MKSLPASFTHTLKNSDSQGLTADLSEVFIDSLLKEGVLKNLPVFDVILGLGKIGIAVNEALFMRKVYVFMTQLKYIPAEEEIRLVPK